jgi:hypothetical protein
MIRTTSGDSCSLNISEEEVEGELSERRVRDMSSDFTVTISDVDIDNDNNDLTIHDDINSAHVSEEDDE